MPSHVTFKSGVWRVTANLYRPTPKASLNRKKAAIVVGHPFGSVKEQTSGLYAERLSKEGFVTLAFDAAHYGESEGEPRYLEDPYQRVEDFKAAVTFLTTLDDVDPERIGVLGICAAGAYVSFAASTDVRMKAVAAVSSLEMGRFFRDGLGNTQSTDQLRQGLAHAAKQRNTEGAGGELEVAPIAPTSLDENAPQLYREGYDYYRTARAKHPRATSVFVTRSLELCASYDSYAFIHLISPRPLLLIAGTKADTMYYSEEAYLKAAEPKQLVRVEGATHMDLYDNEQYLPGVIEKLVDFMDKHLCD
ncbi:alpha/beta-hydrolase [Aspergillus pseudotamarii]|uniref:Alpha/beta-hydrolase n=1 Tax=Aspergillus pseudotamarii TaxID=132259 RepID=A0A5N6SRP8_ASPPS|nr:alpha/beta-hydrolase [Aspergillus pseudotamarii]KAE8137368.1 alpha/beta-hydrolase [Aspergillus pseudotamarii]